MEYVRGLEKATHKTCHVHGLPTQLMGSQAESRLAVSVTMDILMLRCEPWKNLKVQIKKKKYTEPKIMWEKGAIT